jgi:hypothetical protein
VPGALRITEETFTLVATVKPVPVVALMADATTIQSGPSLAPEQGTRKVLTNPPGLRERRCGLGSGILSGWHASAVSGFAVGLLRGA